MPGTVIRDERPADAPAIAAVVTRAFEGHPHSQGREAAIIEGLRRRHALVLGLVAEDGADCFDRVGGREAGRDGDPVASRIVGHVALSAVVIEGSTAGWYALGPLAVRPDRQREGIGSALVREGLRQLRSLGARGCVLLGDPAYYGRFGFRSHPGLSSGSAPAANVLGIGFGIEQPQGEIVFHSAFFE